MALNQVIQVKMRTLAQGHCMVCQGYSDSLSFYVSLLWFLLAYVLALWLGVATSNYPPSPFSFKLPRFQILFLFYYLPHPVIQAILILFSDYLLLSTLSVPSSHSHYPLP